MSISSLARGMGKKLMSFIKETEHWSVFISLFVLFTSIISYYDVHQQLILVAGQVKSYVQVTEARLVEPITDASYIEISLKVKNLGQTVATDVYGEMDYSIATPDFEGKGNSATRRSFGSLGPGLERTFVLKSNRINRREWPKPGAKTFDKTIYFYGSIWYIDDTSKEKRKEDWCYKLVLRHDQDLKKLELEQSTSLIYKSADDE